MLVWSVLNLIHEIWKIKSFLFIFGLFGDPFFVYSPLHHYGLNRQDYRILNRLQELFEETTYDEPEENAQTKSKDDNDKTEGENEKEDENENKKQEENKNEAKNETQGKDSKSYEKFRHIRETYHNGPNVLEEIRERTCDSSTGTVKETTTRRIGDKWFQIEEATNNKGEKFTREKWHNVSSDEVDKFKSTWEKHRGQFGFEHLNLSLSGPNEDKNNK